MNKRTFTHEVAFNPIMNVKEESTGVGSTKDLLHGDTEIELSDQRRHVASREDFLRDDEDLCGRGQELALLADAYLRSTSNVSASDKCHKQQELVLIRGHAGIGKTTLARALRSSVEREGKGYFLSGKFEVSKFQEPYAVFVSAFTQLANELAKGNGSSMEDDRIQHVRHVVGQAMGKEGSVLTNMIPALRQLVGDQHEKTDTFGSDALHQFQSMFCKFCRSISSIVPLVLFIDDLQWADKASIELLQALLLSDTSHKQSSLLIVGAYREEEIHDDDQEEFSSHASASELLQKPPFYFCLRDLTHQCSLSINITKIHLCNMNEDSTNEMVARTLGLSPDLTIDLSRVVHAKSNGNPFHSSQYVLTLLEQGIIYRDSASGQFAWLENLTLSENLEVGSVQDMIFCKLRSLPKKAQDILQISALMGDEVDESALVHVMDGTAPSDISSALELAASDGLLTYVTERGRYRFGHDNIRQAALATIEDKDGLSFKTGRALWQRLPPLYLDAKIFIVASLMKGGVRTITDRVERYRMAALYLDAGLKASSRLAFPDASLYLDTGIECLYVGDYWSDEYTLTLDLMNAAMEAALCNQDFGRVSVLVKEIHERCHNLKDKLPAYVAQINAMGQHESVHEATRVGMLVLRQLGERLPEHATMKVLVGEIIKTKLAFRKRTNESILTLPPMQNEDKVAAMNIMSILLPYTYQAASKQAVVLGTRLARLCLKHGLHSGFALGIATFAMVLCRNQRREGYRMGKLGLEVVEQSGSRQLIPRMYLYFYGFVHHWRCPLRESLDPLAHAAQIGEEIGDVEYAMIALRFKCMHALHCGLSLSLVEQQAVEASHRMTLFKQDNIRRLTTPLIQFVQQMQSGDICSNHWVNAKQLLTEENSGCSNDTTVLFTRYNLGVDLYYAFGNYDLVEQAAELKRQLKVDGKALYPLAVASWKEALTAVAQARLGIRKRRNIKIVKQVLRQMKGWTEDSHSNFWHKQQLLKAELRSLQPGERCVSRNKALYIKAIKGALEEDFAHEAALACELLGDYMNRHGKRSQCEIYWKQAMGLYWKWGAMAKASQMDQRIKDLQDNNP